MADTHEEVDSTSVDTRSTRKPSSHITGMPRWARVSLIVALVLAALFVVAKVTGVGGEHGPGRHGGGEAPSSVIEDEGGHRSPVDHGP